MMTGETTSGLLPDGFKMRMKELLGSDYEAFVASFDEPRTRALRLNSAKVGRDELEDLLGLQLDPLPWCENGYRLPTDVSLGGHPAHLAGLFYLQEPSAMAVAEVLRSPDSGRRTVIDLAASPGGKTTHLADLVGSGGVVVANEIAGGRLRALHDNLDLWGLGNVVTTSEPLDRLVASGLTVDAAVLDAPCTGEALFRRDAEAIRQWSPAAVEGAAKRQQELLALAGQLVGVGGDVVYSTCSFELAENEQQIADLLAVSPHWEVEDTASRLASSGMSIGPVATERTSRLWPHRDQGEGQYVAHLRRTERASDTAEPISHAATGRPAKRRRPARPGRQGSRSSEVSADDVRRAWHDFQGQIVPDLVAASDDLVVTGDRLHRRPPGTGPDGVLPPGLNEARPGLPLGRLRPGRFEPHAGLATSVEIGFAPDSAYRVSWSGNAPQLQAYLRGETVPDQGPDGWVLVCYHRWGIGWARRSKGTLKNLFPGHLRRQAMANQRRGS